MPEVTEQVQHTYRVWMKDGYAGLYDAPTEAEARAQAIAATERNLIGCAIDAADRRKALKVDYVEQLN